MKNGLLTYVSVAGLIFAACAAVNAEWVVPAGAKLSDAQYASFKAGNLYINVHSAEHQSGEIRTQLKP